jgi:protein gp37
MSHRNPRVLGVWGDDGTRVVAADAYWNEPVRWNQEAKESGVRKRVFCASLADVFENRPELDKPRHRLRHLIAQTPHLDWLLLTKRPENIKLCYGGPEGNTYRSWTESWPTNAWLGVSVEDQPAAKRRISILIDTPARVKFLSMEPLLAPVDLDSVPLQGRWLGNIDWVIVGGESGKNARPCEESWVMSVVSQCKEAGVPVFVKQMGSNFYRDGFKFTHKDEKGGDPSEWPEHLQIREFPEGVN